MNDKWRMVNISFLAKKDFDEILLHQRRLPVSAVKRYPYFFMLEFPSSFVILSSFFIPIFFT